MAQSLLDYIYNRGDVTPLSGFEREVWWGEYVQCLECGQYYVMASDQDWGWCKFCDGVLISRAHKEKLQKLIQGNNA